MEKELVFGSKEWMEELDKRVGFPKMFSVYYGVHKESKDAALQAIILDTKSTNPKNLKLGSVTPTLGMALSPFKWLLINAFYFNNADEYVNKMLELSKEWDVEFNN